MTQNQNSAHLDEFLGRLERREARVGILGLGYVGIPLALRFDEVGLPVLGFDVDEERVVTLNRGETPIKHIPAEAIAAMVAAGFEATADFTRIPEADAIVI